MVSGGGQTPGYLIVRQLISQAFARIVGIVRINELHKVKCIACKSECIKFKIGSCALNVSNELQYGLI
jgi:hypothetical protein